MNAFSNHLESAVQNHLLRGTAYQKPGSFWFALFTANPGDVGTDNEVSGGGYARVEVVNNKVNFPQCTTTNPPVKTCGESILFPTATAAWGTVTHWAAYDAPSAVTFAAGTTNASATVTVADTSAIRVGMTITGSGIPASTVITAIVANTSITISNAATATASVTLTVAPKMIVHGALATKRFVKTGKTPKIQGGTLQITIPSGPDGGLTYYAQRGVLDHVFGHLTFASPASVYTGFGTSTIDYTMDEWTDDAYSRQLTAFSAPANGICSNSTDETYTSIDGVADGTVTLKSLAVWDDDNAGHALFYGNLRRDITLNNTDLLKILAGQLTIALQ